MAKDKIKIGKFSQMTYYLVRKNFWSSLAKDRRRRQNSDVQPLNLLRANVNIHETNVQRQVTQNFLTLLPSYFATQYVRIIVV